MGLPMTITHDLKVWPPFFQHIASGAKTFDVRRNDRGFKVGDTIRFREWEPEEHGRNPHSYFTGNEHIMRISYILNPRRRDPDCGLVPGFVVLGLMPTAVRPT